MYPRVANMDLYLAVPLSYSSLFILNKANIKVSYPFDVYRLSIWLCDWIYLESDGWSGWLFESTFGVFLIKWIPPIVLWQKLTSDLKMTAAYQNT